MTKTKLATIIILIAISLGLIIYDIVVAVNPVRGDTISEVILGYARRHPVIPFAFGVLMGHLFWPQMPK